MMSQKRHPYTITAVEAIMPTPTTIVGYTVSTDCGHTFTGAPHFYWKVGTRGICSTHDDGCRCFTCAESAPVGSDR